MGLVREHRTMNLADQLRAAGNWETAGAGNDRDRTVSEASQLGTVNARTISESDGLAAGHMTSDAHSSMLQQQLQAQAQQHATDPKLQMTQQERAKLDRMYDEVDRADRADFKFGADRETAGDEEKVIADEKTESGLGLGGEHKRTISSSGSLRSATRAERLRGVWFLRRLGAAVAVSAAERDQSGRHNRVPDLGPRRNQPLFVHCFPSAFVADLVLQ